MRILSPYELAGLTNGIAYHKIFRNQEGGVIYGKKYRFDFREDYNDILHVEEIFIGDKKECIKIEINNKEAHIQTFQHFNHCDIYKKLPRISGTATNVLAHSLLFPCNSKKSCCGTRILMRTALEYLYFKKNIKKVSLTDNAVYDKKNCKISFFILYLYKYGKSYYEKNFGFKYIKRQDIIDEKENLKIREKHFINKKNAIKELQKYYSKTKIDRLMENIKDGETISELTNRYIYPEELCDIYFKLLEYEFRRKPYYNLFGHLLQKRLIFKKSSKI